MKKADCAPALETAAPPSRSRKFRGVAVNAAPAAGTRVDARSPGRGGRRPGGAVGVGRRGGLALKNQGMKPRRSRPSRAEPHSFFFRPERAPVCVCLCVCRRSFPSATLPTHPAPTHPGRHGHQGARPCDGAHGTVAPASAAACSPTSPPLASFFQLLLLSLSLSLSLSPQSLSKLLGDNAPACRKDQKFENYFGRKIAVDASMHIYQFMVRGARRRERDGGTATAAHCGPPQPPSPLSHASIHTLLSSPGRRRPHGRPAADGRDG